MLTCTVSLIFLAFVGLLGETSQALCFRHYHGTNREYIGAFGGVFGISTDELERFRTDVKELFTQYDKNKDGVLGDDELLRIILRDKRRDLMLYGPMNRRSMSAFVAKYSVRLDDDRDGKLTMKDLERPPVTEKPAYDDNYEKEKSYEGSGDY